MKRSDKTNNQHPEVIKMIVIKWSVTFLFQIIISISMICALFSAIILISF